MIAPFIAQVSSLSWLLHPGVLRPHVPSCVLQVLMSRSVIQALTPFAVASLICAFGTYLLPIETKGRALLVRNLLTQLLGTLLGVFKDFSFNFSKTPDGSGRNGELLLSPGGSNV